MKKTIKRGLRPFDDGIAPSLERPAQEIKGLVEKFLSNNQPKINQNKKRERAIYILKRVKKAAERLAISDEIQKEKILSELKGFERKGRKLGFSPEQMWAANAVALLIKKEGWLEKFIQQAEEAEDKLRKAK